MAFGYFGGWYYLAVLLVFATSSVGIVVDIVILLGCLPLIGWESNFSFLLLSMITACCIQEHFFYAIASLISLIDIDFLDGDNYQSRLLGTLLYVPFITIQVLTVCLTLNRIYYSRRPLLKNPYLTKTMLQCFIVCIIAFHFLLSAFFLNSQPTLVVFHPNDLSYGIFEGSSPLIYRINDLLNLFVGCFNLTAYTALFIYLYLTKQLTFATNKELTMTVQVFATVLVEVLFFLFWLFIEGDNALTLTLGVLSNNLFCISLVLPYLLFNGRVRRNLHSLYSKRSTIHQSPPPLMF